MDENRTRKLADLRDAIAKGRIEPSALQAEYRGTFEIETALTRRADGLPLVPRSSLRPLELRAYSRPLPGVEHVEIEGADGKVYLATPAQKELHDAISKAQLEERALDELLDSVALPVELTEVADRTLVHVREFRRAKAPSWRGAKGLGLIAASIAMVVSGFAVGFAVGQQTRNDVTARPDAPAPELVRLDSSSSAPVDFSSDERTVHTAG